MVSIYWTLAGGSAVPADSAFLEHSLSVAEQIYLQSLRFPRRRADWLLGRWVAKHLLRTVDERLRGVEARRISVLRSAQGSPQVWVSPENPFPVSLSLSHREGWAACAVAPVPNWALGIDLEVIEPRPRSFVEDFFTLDEQAFLHRLSVAQAALAVTLMWSLKEAALKALRVGLTWDTRRVNVCLPSGLSPDPSWRAARITVRGVQASWQAWWCVVGQNVLTLAVCTETRPEALVYVPLRHVSTVHQSIGC
ncbi:4'-phosphopantetheinyl transferase superfamily protein [uncultured Thermanaerothrix sp.]|uniref:4'-phosphopantetheinyl transferase family protein n=1 Tax=uncultured Thermanaerothrix sp. TaxID=1195149 RepID=UPI002621044A|nr:4'-phosphopantetheinyl transferase superfamily protein [uncultured Thermanaerothrix sp.]